MQIASSAVLAAPVSLFSVSTNVVVGRPGWREPWDGSQSSRRLVGRSGWRWQCPAMPSRLLSHQQQVAIPSSLWHGEDCPQWLLVPSPALLNVADLEEHTSKNNPTHRWPDSERSCNPTVFCLPSRIAKFTHQDDFSLQKLTVPVPDNINNMAVNN